MSGGAKRQRDPTERLPWVKWYHRDWRGDPRLRIVGPAARGLWMDMLAIMDEGEPYGHLVAMGRPMVARDLAALVGGTTEREVAKLLKLLEEAGVFSRCPDGTIFSRRMVRDRARSDAGRANGALGGNPQIVGDRADGVNPPIDAGVNPQDAEGVNPVLAHAPATQRPEGRKKEESFALLSDRGSDTPVPAGEGRASQPTPRKSVGRSEPEGFLAFYATYPRHEARKDAADAYRQVVTEAGGAEALLAHLRRFSFDADPKFIPLPASWLRGRRWQDERLPREVAAASSRPVDEQYWTLPLAEVRALPKPPVGTPDRLAWDEAFYNRRPPRPRNTRQEPSA